MATLTCSCCDRKVDTATTRISIYTTLDQPIYTFDCRHCGHSNERRITDDRFDALAAILSGRSSGQRQ